MFKDLPPQVIKQHPHLLFNAGLLGVPIYQCYLIVVILLSNSIEASLKACDILSFKCFNKLLYNCIPTETRTQINSLGGYCSIH